MSNAEKRSIVDKAGGEGDGEDRVEEGKEGGFAAFVGQCVDQRAGGVVATATTTTCRSSPPKSTLVDRFAAAMMERQRTKAFDADPSLLDVVCADSRFYGRLK